MDSLTRSLTSRGGMRPTLYDARQGRVRTAVAAAAAVQVSGTHSYLHLPAQTLPDTILVAPVDPITGLILVRSYFNRSLAGFSPGALPEMQRSALLVTEGIAVIHRPTNVVTTLMVRLHRSNITCDW